MPGKYGPRIKCDSLQQRYGEPKLTVVPVYVFTNFRKLRDLNHFIESTVTSAFLRTKDVLGPQTILL